MKFTDAAVTGRTKKTQEGYLIATSKVARVGVQKYLARELGDVAEHLPPDQIVSVYRHPDQVFADAAMQSLTRVPVTIDHPSEMVDADNWSDYAVGDVGDAFKRDGDWIVVQPMLKDSAAVLAARTTHKEISMGYTANIVPARDGIDADFEMTDIRFNHLALVPKGRAGADARIGDADNWGASPVTVEDKKMTELKAVSLGDKAVQVEAKDADAVKAAFGALEAKLDLKDAEIAELKGKVLSDADIAAMVDRKIELNKKREAVKAKVGDKAADYDDAKIEIAFELLDHVPAEVDDSARQALADAKPMLDAEAKIKAAIEARFNKGNK